MYCNRSRFSCSGFFLVTAVEQFLLIGLGNPGVKYRNTRHNAGFLVVDYFALQHNLSYGDVSLQAYIAEGQIHQTQAVVAKPQTYMNASGQAVILLVEKYKIEPDHILLIHDDIDLPFGRVKMTAGGGAGGHKGVLSIIECLGTNTFPRLKFGIGRPQDKTPIEQYVLAPFTDDENILITARMKDITKGIVHFFEKGIISAMNFINSL